MERAVPRGWRARLSTNLNSLVAELAGPAREFVEALGAARLLPQVTSTLRSTSEQRRLFDRYQRGLSKFPAAPPGQSAHEYGLAFDLTCQDQELAGRTWLEWGGFWSPADYVHFELPGATAWARQQQPDPIVVDPPWYAAWLGNLLSIGPWWAGISGADLLKKAVRIEKAIGVDAAVDFLWRHLGENPDQPR